MNPVSLIIKSWVRDWAQALNHEPFQGYQTHFRHSPQHSYGYGFILRPHLCLRFIAIIQDTLDRRRRVSRASAASLLLSLTVGLVLSVPAAGVRSTPATGCGAPGATRTTWRASRATRARGSCPRGRSLAWWRKRCCAGSTTTPWWRTSSERRRAVSGFDSLCWMTSIPPRIQFHVCLDFHFCPIRKSADQGAIFRIRSLRGNSTHLLFSVVRHNY